jgi:hypothetical protein
MNFDDIFGTALDAGLGAARAGGMVAEDWLRRIAAANRETLLAIATATASREISQETATMLLNENERTMQSEAAALSVIVRATAQAAVNAFLNSLRGGLSAALGIAI